MVWPSVVVLGGPETLKGLSVAVRVRGWPLSVPEDGETLRLSAVGTGAALRVTVEETLDVKTESPE